jgi:hypothetical protein
MSNMPPPSGYLVPPAPGANPRPGTVTVSSLLIYVSAVALLISAAVSVYTFAAMPSGYLEDAYRDAGLDRTLAESTAVITQASIYVVAVLYALLAVFFVVLGLLVNKGKQWARITTWVLGGIGLCCIGFGLMFQSVGGGFNTGTANGIDQDLLNERMLAAQPSWATTVGTGLSVVLLLSMLAAIILLALPPSNAFFRKPAPVWTPPAYPAA